MTPPHNREDSQDAFQDVAADSEVPEGNMKGFEVAGERVLVARVQGRLHAVGGLCTHQIAYLEDGVLEGRQVSCPRHGACFDLESGEPLSAPADLPLPVHDVHAAGGRILVSIRPRPCRGS
jgi:3-phenylpropionate/trans-cinnamate dioxygenase ferredoxin component